MFIYFITNNMATGSPSEYFALNNLQPLKRFESKKQKGRLSWHTEGLFYLKSTKFSQLNYIQRIIQNN